MFIQKKQALKRFTYICLSLSSIVITSDVQSMNEDQIEDYRKTHNRIAAKYGLTQHKIHPRASHQSTMVEEAEKLRRASENLRRKEEERLEEVNNFGKKVVDGGSTVADIVINENVKDEKAKNILIQLKNELTGLLKGIFD